jgi:hypothetical protein
MATVDNSAENPQQHRVGKVWDRAAITSRALRILFVIAAVIISANVVAGNPMVLFANATASLVGPWEPESLKGDEIALLRKARTETALSGPEVEALTEQFQTWAAEVDARAHVQLPAQRAKDIRASVAKKTKLAQVSGHNRLGHQARAMVRRTKHARRHVRHGQYVLADDWWFARWSERQFGGLY